MQMGCWCTLQANYNPSFENPTVFCVRKTLLPATLVGISELNINVGSSPPKIRWRCHQPDPRGHLVEACQ